MAAGLEALRTDAVSSNLSPGLGLRDRIGGPDNEAAGRMQGVNLGLGQDRKAEGGDWRGSLGQSRQLLAEVLGKPVGVIGQVQAQFAIPRRKSRQRPVYFACGRPRRRGHQKVYAKRGVGPSSDGRDRWANLLGRNAGGGE